MIRTLVSLTFVASLFSACSGPVETRVETRINAPLSSPWDYRFSEKAGQSNDAYKRAHRLVDKALAAKGGTRTENGVFLVQLALADRPASLTISAGEKEKKHVLAAAKEKELLQSCDDSEHRFSISLLDQRTGLIAYRGDALEYHCKGTLNGSLPHLVKAALSQMGGAPTSSPKISKLMRSGTD